MYFSPTTSHTGCRDGSHIAVSACQTEFKAGKAPGEILLIPAGPFRARDGRPEGVPHWYITSEGARRIIAQAAAAPGDFVIDYEHQTLKTDTNGLPAPAAGWFKALEWREGKGLYATDVRWTERARAAIESGEYRYISPVFGWDRRTGEVRSLLMAAITNFPAIEGHSDLAAIAAARFNAQKEDHTVNKEQLIALLGLQEDASEEQITNAITALKAKAEQLSEKESQIAALKAAQKPDLSSYVPMETFEALKSEVTALHAERQKREVEDLVARGLEEGKLLPAQKDWATELGGMDIEALKTYLDKTPAIAALRGTQTNGKAPEQDPLALDDQEIAICKQLGIEPDRYIKEMKRN